MNLIDVLYLSPVLALVVFGIVALMVGLCADRAPKGKLAHYLPSEGLAIALTVPVIVLAGGVLYWTITSGPRAMFFAKSGMQPLLMVDGFAAVIGVIAALGTVVVMLCSLEYFAKRRRHQAEFYSLLMFATAAIMLAAAATDFLAIYLSIEFLSLISYALAAFMKDDKKSSEAGIKYFLFGAVSSAVMLYGISILFGLTGSTNLTQVAQGLTSGDPGMVTAPWVATIFVLAGIGFKVALVPFHIWAPDVYQGAPTPITAFLSVGSKAAGLAVLTRVLLVALPDASVNWFTLLLILSAVSMTFGNLVAIPQQSIKRMMAYSSIAQVGYIIVGILAATRTAQGFVPDGLSITAGQTSFALPGLLIYIFSYLLMNLGAFAVVIAVEKRAGTDDIIEGFSGLAKVAPFYAVSLVVFFLSLAGIPPTAGFIGKFYIFGAAIQSAYKPLVILAAIAVINSVISVYYYFNVVRVMFFQEPDVIGEIHAAPALRIALITMLAATILVCIFVQPVANVVHSSLTPFISLR